MCSNILVSSRTQPTFVKEWRHFLERRMPQVLGGRSMPIRRRYPCVLDIDTYYAFYGQLSKGPPMATGANSRRKLPSVAWPMQTLLQAPFNLIDERNAECLPIFPQVGSNPQELDGPGYTIHGTSTRTTLQSISRAYV